MFVQKYFLNYSLLFLMIFFIACGNESTTSSSKTKIDFLVEALKGDDLNKKLAAAASLSEMGAKAEVAVPILIKCLDHENANMRYSAVIVLGKIGPGAKDAVPTLLNCLEDKRYQDIKDRIIRAFSGIGPGAKDATPYRIKALSHKDEYTRSDAAEALGNVNSTKEGHARSSQCLRR